MALRRRLRLFFLAACCLAGVVSEPTEDKVALLDFLDRTPHGGKLQWSPSSSACQWRGVTCDANRSRVVALRLPAAGLAGPVPPDTLSRLGGLRILSLRSNLLSGALPPDLANLGLLRALYLQENRLSGELPPWLARLGGLVRLDLSGNGFRGSIPLALGNLTRATGLFLQSNNFSGGIPALDLPRLVQFNVSDNRLEGPIPEPLRRFPSSSFAGNLALCGDPLASCAPFPPAQAPSPEEKDADKEKKTKKKRRLPAAWILAIAIAGGAVLLAALLLLAVCLVRRLRRRRSQGKSPKAAAAAAAAIPRSPGRAEEAAEEQVGEEGSKVVFFEEGLYEFDLEDLLRASAEVLGKGSMGTSYKAVLEDGVTVVVKRLKDVALSQREFEAQMAALGAVKSPHLVPLRAFYFSKDEKLLVYDYFPAGSLSAFLHGRSPSLDWPARVGVAAAAARGLAHLHGAARVVHGNVKASNVLLLGDGAAAVADYGLAALFGAAWPSRRAAGYWAPEVAQTRRASFKGDVYSFGVLLLELLTGKAPGQGHEGADLPRWVRSVVREEWTAEVFDAELVGRDGAEEEMVRVLQVAMACVQTVPDSRPDMADVVRMLDEIRGPAQTEPSPRSSPDDDGPSKRPPRGAATLV